MDVNICEHVELNMGHIRLCWKITGLFELMQLYHFH